MDSSKQASKRSLASRWGASQQSSFPFFLFLSFCPAAREHDSRIWTARLTTLVLSFARASLCGIGCWWTGAGDGSATPLFRSSLLQMCIRPRFRSSPKNEPRLRSEVGSAYSLSGKSARARQKNLNEEKERKNEETPVCVRVCVSFCWCRGARSRLYHYLRSAQASGSGGGSAAKTRRRLCVSLHKVFTRAPLAGDDGDDARVTRHTLPRPFWGRRRFLRRKEGESARSLFASKVAPRLRLARGSRLREHTHTHTGSCARTIIASIVSIISIVIIRRTPAR